MSERDWVVWGEEHGGRWRPGSMGYTPYLREAGRYSEEQAKLIEAKANRYLPGGRINEIAMPDPWRNPDENPDREGAGAADIRP